MGNILSEGVLRITNHSGDVTELAGDDLRWESPYKDEEEGVLVHVATIEAEVFQGLPEDVITLKLLETEDGGIQGGEVVVDRNSGGYDVETEDLIVTIEDDLDIGETDE
jgi:hypothetical protein